MGRNSGGLNAGWRAAMIVSAWWTGVAAVIVAIPFCVVWARMSWDSAFEIVTGTKSPFQPGLGPAGSILALVGYLLVPVVVGAVASLWFARNLQMVYGENLIEAAAGQIKKDLGI